MTNPQMVTNISFQMKRIRRSDEFKGDRCAVLAAARGGGKGLQALGGSKVGA